MPGGKAHHDGTNGIGPSVELVLGNGHRDEAPESQQYGGFGKQAAHDHSPEHSDNRQFVGGVEIAHQNPAEGLAQDPGLAGPVPEQ